MPPRFEAAQPFIPSISEAYGASESILRGNATLSDAYQTAARMRFQQQQAAADRASRSQEAGLDRAQQGDALSARAMGQLGEQNVRAQQMEFDRTAESQRQMAQFAQQRALVEYQAHAQRQDRAESQMLGSWLRRQEFTHADQLELQKQERQLRAVMDPTNELTPQERKRAALTLTSGIDSLRMRQQETQQKMQEQQVKMLTTQQESLSNALTAGSELEKKAKEQGIGVMNFGVDPDTRLPRLFFKNPTTGEWYNPMATSAKGAGSEQKAAVDIASSVSKELTAELSAYQKAAAADPATAKPAWAGSQEEYRKEALFRANLYREMSGLPPIQGGQTQVGVGEVGAYKFGDEGNWPGFDPNNPPPGEPTALVQRTLRDQAEVDADQRIPKDQRDAYIAGLGALMNLVAKQHKTDEDRKRIVEMGRTLRRPEPPAVAQQPQQVNPVFSNAALSMRGGF